MSQPTTYSRKKDFANDNPDRVDLNAINTELDSVGKSVNATIRNLGLIQGDDGKLLAGVVGKDSIDPQLLEDLKPKDGKDGLPGKDGKDGEKGDVGASFVADRIGTESERFLFNSMPKGFSFLAMDTGLLYWKLSDAIGDWSSGVTFGKGDRGEKGEKGNDGERGERGVAGVKGDPGERGLPGENGLITSVDTQQKTINIIGKKYVTAKLKVTNGEISIVLTAE